MNLPLVDAFTTPYEVWETRSPTPEEMFANQSKEPINVRLKEIICDAKAAAEYMAKIAFDNRLGNHIQTALSESSAYKSWQSVMPSITPAEIARYQKDYQNSDFPAVSKEINENGGLLTHGQCLFHGGLWRGGSSMTTIRPLSTSLCPQVALRNAEFKGKAYDENRLDLFMLRVANPTTKGFVFKRKGTKLGHESEVLMASGARLTLNSEKLIRSNYMVAKYQYPNKEIPIYVLEIELS